ncbi:hypothetical protein [Clostridium estertheticum]|uniref:Uncharacterized protein n=1 Tax=Clostridium estertheticum subsp. estertheticum TaxID=1552 RepID=A0A1J0GG79_9CLOT|nr:hypothetical protein [Clostridium estertheticum]APC40325.1 hypothetical protein A7L45_09740 [Clostridium estertheticum subsp. estertheticum]MBU3174293.1 hypothetical protein [Clostridium estertheticum]MBZ9617858.1 hypothetical protein [Clostridium estertheticum subsp. laramiense]WAG73522.1 hypothetical protein LL032_20735 [Clostridium estertheticum]
MEQCYVLKINEEKNIQENSDLCFIGGYPRIPISATIPKCKLCNKEQTFMFQVAFPENHVWYGLSMAIFACTSCAKEGYFIPEMLNVHLKGANIPLGFLDKYQKNFKSMIFETSEARVQTDYCEKVKFKKWDLIKATNNKINKNKIGGIPKWVLDDETPSTYNYENSMFFIMQIFEEFEFEKSPKAPPQIELSLTG